jgi:stage IV sporulation protein B
VKRADRILKYPVKPLYCGETERYRIGLYVRDGVAGVGTLSFVDPETGKYAALGHVILDADTRQQIDVRQGRLVEASVQTIQPGRPGRPGEKIGIFKTGEAVEGNVEKNTFYGIYGQLSKGIENQVYPQSVEVAYAHQVHTGPAKMLTVLGGDEVQEFDIMLEKVYPNRSNSKGLVIRVTDPRVSSVAGGIVQGMSGSPILQDGRLIGVVTHVFLNDPLHGYGTFLDNMLREMNGEDMGLDSRQVSP